MFVCSPDWLKISMYLEMTQPLQDPKRLEKVFKRLQLFEDEFKYSKCSSNSDNKSLNDTINNILQIKVVENEKVKKLLSYIKHFVQINKLVNYGASAYNFYIKGHKYTELHVNYFETYTDKLPKKYYEPLMEKLESDFSGDGFTFRLVPRIMIGKI